MASEGLIFMRLNTSQSFDSKSFQHEKNLGHLAFKLLLFFYTQNTF
jgi:hypothetical protein